jgi:hypothetical protein
MRISRGKLAFLGVLIFLAGPVLWLAGSFFFEAMIENVMQGADEISKVASSKQLIAGIFLLLLVAGFVGGGTFFVIVGIIGGLLLLMLRELQELREIHEQL